MRYGKFRLALPLAVSLVLAACVTPPPLNDHITLVPVSDKADIESGLTMSYLYGAQENIIGQVACQSDGSCLFGGHAYSSDQNNAQLDSLVIRTSNGHTLDWARTYQIENIINNNLGMLPTADGGALLYGNSVLTNSLVTGLKPVYEKIDARGIPEWGGALQKGQTRIFTSFTDAIKLSQGGYALAGSSLIKGQWRGTVLRLDSSGNQTWFTTLDNADQISFLMYLTELPNNHILGVGLNKTRNDMTLYDLAPDGHLVHAKLLQMPGSEIPVGIAQTHAGPVIIASVKRPNGEHAALVVHFDWSGKPGSATLYRYSNGFDPNDLIMLANRKLCLYGSTASEDHPQSLAFTIDSQGHPRSAIALRGDSAFLDGVPLSPGKILFGGGRKIGADQKDSGLIVTWTPSIENQRPVLSHIKRTSVKLQVQSPEDAEQQLYAGSVVVHFRNTDMTSRLVSGNEPAAHTTAHPKKASDRQ